MPVSSSTRRALSSVAARASVSRRWASIVLARRTTYTGAMTAVAASPNANSSGSCHAGPKVVARKMPAPPTRAAAIPRGCPKRSPCPTLVVTDTQASTAKVRLLNARQVQNTKWSRTSAYFCRASALPTSLLTSQAHSPA